MCVKAVEVRLVVVKPQLLSAVELKQAPIPISWEWEPVTLERSRHRNAMTRSTTRWKTC